MSPILKTAMGNGNVPGTQNLARTLYKELRANGCGTDDVLAICTQIIDEITTELGREGNAQADASAA